MDQRDQWVEHILYMQEMRWWNIKTGHGHYVLHIIQMQRILFSNVIENIEYRIL